jgi:DNA-binding response OmpR family regulator
MSIETCEAETILLVDDEQEVRTLVGACLRRAGYHVIEAESGDEATRLFRQHGDRIRIVVSDIVMLGLHGPAFVQRLIEGRPDLCVLFISGHLKASPSTLRLDHRHAAFLPKPFSPAALVTAVQELVARARVEPSITAGNDASPLMRTVLIIDRDWATTDTYTRTLQREGLRVMTATSAQDGLRQAIGSSPGVVIMERRLPDMDGVEVLRLLRRSPARRASVTVVTDDYSIDDHAARDFSALQADICLKPLWPDDLVAIARGQKPTSTYRR